MNVPRSWLVDLASRLERAQCWRTDAKPFGRGTSSRWWDLNPADVQEAALRLRQYAQGIEARSVETAGLGPQDESPVAKPCAQTPGDSA